MSKPTRTDIFMDSGAFSAYSKGVVIDLDVYIAFLQEYAHELTVYANLDVIGDPAATLRNQQKMEAAGLSPLPVFHYGEPLKYLKYYVQRYGYLALGGMVGRPSVPLRKWLDLVWSEYLLDEQRMPRLRIHGFGLTTVSLLMRYPWYSVDSSSALMVAAAGSIMVPHHTRNGWDYTRAHICTVSGQSPTAKQKGRHYTTISESAKQRVEAYLQYAGLCMGTMKDKQVPAEYKLQTGEHWRDRSAGVVCAVDADGVCNNYRMRIYANAMYYHHLESALPEYPRPARFDCKRALL